MTLAQFFQCLFLVVLGSFFMVFGALAAAVSCAGILLMVLVDAICEAIKGRR
jgi:hypothetical protein